MAKQTRKSRPEQPLNPAPQKLEDELRQQAGLRQPEDQGSPFDASEIDTLGDLTPTDIERGELEAGVNDDLPDDPERLEMLTELELRAEETDDPREATEEGFTYVSPIDPPTVPGSRDDAEIASGLGVSALDEPFDQDHHSSFLESDDEVSARVRDALRADSATTQYADRISIETHFGRVTLRGVVDDIIDSDNIVAVAEYATGVEEVIDQLDVRSV
jgi:hypothetical protein